MALDNALTISLLRYWAKCLRRGLRLSATERRNLRKALCDAAEQIDRADKAKRELSYWLHS